MTIEELYQKIDKHIIIVKGYLEDPNIDMIIKFCRLKPYKMLITSENRFDSKLHRHWIDEYGNSLYITNKKNIVISTDELKIDRSKIQCTDIYDGLSIQQTANISKMLWAKKTRYQMLCFVGLDNYLRTFIRLDGLWEKCSSLLLGIEMLRCIVKNIDINHISILDEGWLMKWPISKEIIQDCGASYLLQEIIE